MNTSYTLAELLTVNLARSFKDREVGFTGLVTGGAAALYGTAIPLAAMSLAKEMHAPGLTILLAGWSHNPDLSALDQLPDSEFDSLLRDLPCEAHMMSYPGTWAIRRGDIDFGFSSAVQVDRVGNINSVCIGEYEHPKVRLVGPILQPEHMALFGREYVMLPHHHQRNFVDQVDFISGVGHPGGAAGRAELGLRGGGPEWVVTPKCILDFDRTKGAIRYKSVHNASDRKNPDMFFLDLDPSAVDITPPPTTEELDVLRRKVDPKKVLLR
ncbi:3-oxoadipate CoA-transferase subunit B [compost metagenome]